MARVGAAKVWNESSTTDVEAFENLSQDELDVLAGNDNIELIDSETDAIGLISGTIGIERDTSQVMIEVIPPEPW